MRYFLKLDKESLSLMFVGKVFQIRGASCVKDLLFADCKSQLKLCYISRVISEADHRLVCVQADKERGKQLNGWVQLQ